MPMQKKQGGAAPLFFFWRRRIFATLQISRGYLASGMSDMRVSTEQIKSSKPDAGHIFAVPGNARLYGEFAKDQCGFSLVELIAVMVLIGILAAVAIPRFFDKNVFDSRGYYDQVLSTLRFAQKTAVAQHRSVCVTFAVDSITLSIDSSIPPDGGCDANLISPAGVTPFTVTAPDGVTFAAPGVGTVFSFDALGRPSATPGISIHGYSTAITVEAETGYVH